MGSAPTPRTVIGAANPWVWCERCQKVHRHYTFTKEDEERILIENVARLREAIDQQIRDEVFNVLKWCTVTGHPTLHVFDAG